MWGFRPEEFKALTDIEKRFSLPPSNEYGLEISAALRQGWGTYVSGLLFHDFSAATDKLDLRTRVQQRVKLLSDRDYERKDALHEVLAKEADKALRLQVNI